MKIVGIVFSLVLSFSVHGQNDTIKTIDEEKMDKIMATLLTPPNIRMDIDEILYPVSQGNNHFTSDEKAGITASVIPVSYERMKTDMENEKGVDRNEILDMGEFESDGSTILYMKQKLQRGEETFIMHMYIKKIDDDSCLTIGGFFENGKKDSYTNDIRKAAMSAEIIK